MDSETDAKFPEKTATPLAAAAKAIAAAEPRFIHDGDLAFLVTIPQSCTKKHEPGHRPPMFRPITLHSVDLIAGCKSLEFCTKKKVNYPVHDPKE